MFTLTSTSTKFAVLAFSAAISVASFQSVALSFQAAVNPVSSVSSVPLSFVELPTVVIVGQRASVLADSVQAASRVSTKAAI